MPPVYMQILSSLCFFYTKCHPVFKNTTMAGTEEKKTDSNIEERNDNVTESQKCQPSCKICYPSKIVSTSGNIEKS